MNQVSTVSARMYALVVLYDLHKDYFHRVLDKIDEPFSMEGFTMSHFELVSFMIYREANCIGQIALWRRLLGYAPMNYM